MSVSRPRSAPPATASASRNGRPPVTRQEIVRAALELIEEEGLEVLSMRRLAKRLGVYPTAIYYHAGNKAQLMALVFQEVMGQMVLPDSEGLSWQDWMRAMAAEARRALGEYPALASYFVAEIQVNSASLRLSEMTLDVLHDAGFKDALLVKAYNAIIGAVFGWISGEYSADPSDADAGWQSHFENELTRAADELPVLRANRDRLANRAFMLRWSSGPSAEMSESFYFMLDALLLGLEGMRQRS